MENLDFVLWVTLFPLSVDLQEYFSAKTDKIKGEKPKEFTEQQKERFLGFMTIVYLLISILLWFN